VKTVSNRIAKIRIMSHPPLPFLFAPAYRRHDTEAVQCRIDH
jgi:hypothetical protein